MGTHKSGKLVTSQLRATASHKRRRLEVMGAHKSGKLVTSQLRATVSRKRRRLEVMGYKFASRVTVIGKWECGVGSSMFDGYNRFVGDSYRKVRTWGM